MFLVRKKEKVEKENERNLNQRKRQFPSVASQTLQAAALQVAVNRLMCLSVPAHSTRPTFEKKRPFKPKYVTGYSKKLEWKILDNE